MTRAEIAFLLPGAFQRALGGGADGTPLPAFLSVMEALHERPEWQIDEFDRVCDPFRAPDAFVPFLARWVGLGPILGQPRGTGRGTDYDEDPITTGLGRLRVLTADAAALAKWRGTAEGLRRFLETATGLDGFVVEETPAGASEPSFHLHVRAPAGARPHRALVVRAIDLERPGYCTWSLTFAGSEDVAEEKKEVAGVD
jgi:phage tail-like protein